MRTRNWRVISAGVLLIVFALGFFFFISGMSTQSTDPAMLRQTVGTLSGALIGLSVAMIIIGLIGKKV